MNELVKKYKKIAEERLALKNIMEREVKALYEEIGIEVLKEMLFALSANLYDLSTSKEHEALHNALDNKLNQIKEK